MGDPIRPALLDILQHALGLDEHGLYKGEREGYRNRFASAPDCDHYVLCRELTEAGLMVEHTPPRGDVRSYSTFVVTDRGREVVAEQSPPPPRLTRGQRRYQEYLDSDSGMSFGDWLRRCA